MRQFVAFLVVALGARASAAELTVGPYLQDVRPDGFTVVYETDAPSDGELHVLPTRAPAPPRDPHESADPHLDVMLSTIVVKSPRATRHELRVDGLREASHYRYSVLVDGAPRPTSDGAPVAPFEVATAPASERPFTFVVYGDTRDGGDLEPGLIAAMAAESPELAVNTGDLVRRGGDVDSWPLFFRDEEALLSRPPMYPAAGNHELYGDPAGAQFRRWFVLPDGGRERRYYSFRWGAARFVFLDGNAAAGPAHDAETAWLSSTLEAAKRSGERHVFVVMHQPVLSMGGHCGAGAADADWAELFERHRVSAVFAGHDHSYQRLERNGVRYFVSGGGGAPVYAENTGCPGYDQEARRAFAPEHHYLRVRVAGASVEVAALRLDGPPIETVRFDDRAVARGTARPAMPFTPFVAGSFDRRWPLAAGGLALLVLLRGLLRRRRR